MAAGLPIVSTAAGGAAELVTNDETALVVDCRNPHAISRAIGLLLDDPHLASRLAAAARLASRDYTPEAYAASIVSLYAAAVRPEG
jgi:glycosyltransferase involved in cell wall biosynthesis